MKLKKFRLIVLTIVLYSSSLEYIGFRILKKNVFLRSRQGFLFLEIVLLQVFSNKALTSL